MPEPRGLFVNTTGKPRGGDSASLRGPARLDAPGRVVEDGADPAALRLVLM